MIRYTSVKIISLRNLLLVNISLEKEKQYILIIENLGKFQISCLLELFYNQLSLKKKLQITCCVVFSF